MGIGQGRGREERKKLDERRGDKERSCEGRQNLLKKTKRVSVIVGYEIGGVHCVERLLNDCGLVWAEEGKFFLVADRDHGRGAKIRNRRKRRGNE